MINRWILSACAGIALLCIVGLYGYGKGKDRVQDQWDAERAQIALETAKQEQQAIAERAEYDRKLDAQWAANEQEKANAYERGRAAGAAIAAGTVRVREVWRDCPATAAGEGAESDGRAADLFGRRADAIGGLFGAAGVWDATYALAIGRLNAAQGLLNQCYEQPGE